MKSQAVLWCAIVAMCLAVCDIAAANAEETEEGTSSPVRIDLRKDIGGCLVRGTTRMSPTAQGGSAFVRLSVDGRTVSDWTKANPYWNTTYQDDGWHTAALRENFSSTEASVVVMNRVDIVIHGGTLSADDSWEEGKVHIVRDWVRIPEGLTLKIQPGAIVKFCSGVGLVVNGALQAQGAVFTCVSDEGVGGDTSFLDAPEFNYDQYSFTGTGNRVFTDCDFRMLHDLPDGTLWQAGSVHTVHGRMTVSSGSTLTIAPNAIVKLADGAELYCEEGGTVVCSEVIFTHLADDSAGGDTNGDGNATQPAYGAYELTGFTPDDDCELRYCNIDVDGITVEAGETHVIPVGRSYKVNGDILVKTGARLEIQPGVVIKIGNGYGIVVQTGGELVATGAVDQKVTITSMQDGTVAGNSDTAPVVGDWRGMAVNGSVSLEHVRIAYGGDTAGAIQVQNGSLSLLNSLVAKAKGACIRAYSGEVSVKGSLLLSSDTSVHAEAASSCALINCDVYDMQQGLRGQCITVANTIFSDVASFGVTDSDVERISHCLFYNPAGVGEQVCALVGRNGNLWGAPGFTDAEAEDFTIGTSSPCVDAGDGGVCPDTDYYGNLRSDVLSVENSGTESSNGGVPDIGACESAGSNPLYMEFTVAGGWNIMSLPWTPADCESNRVLSSSLNMMQFTTNGAAMTPSDLPDKAGQVIWGYSSKVRDCRMKYWETETYSTFWRRQLNGNWYIMGVAGVDEYLYTRSDVTSLWSWVDGRWTLVERGTGGYVLKPYHGYMAVVE